MSVHIVRVTVPAQTIEVELHNVEQWDEALGPFVDQMREHVANHLPPALGAHFGRRAYLVAELVEVLRLDGLDEDDNEVLTSLWSAAAVHGSAS